MKNVAGMALLALGIVLLILGLNESQSFSSEVSRVFTGNPTDRSIWLIVGGALAVVSGLGLVLVGVRRRS